MFRGVVLVFLLWFSSVPVISQSIVNYESYFDNYLIRTLDREDGFPGEQNFFTHEDSDGFIWIANIDGLVRYDGLNLRVFNNGYKGGTLYEIYEKKNENFLLPSIGEGLYEFDGDTLIQYKTEFPSPSGFIKSMVLTESGLSYVGLYGEGVSVFDGDSVIQHFTDEDGLLSEEVWKIIEDRNGRIWIGTNDGLSIYDGENFINFTTENGLPYNTIRGLTEMKNGDVWIGTDKEGIVIFRDYQPVEYIHSDEGLSGLFPQYFAENPIDGSIWIAHHGNGLDRYKDGKIENLTADDGLLSNYLTYVGFSKDGTAFIGHETGMSVLTNKITGTIDEKISGIDQPASTTVIEDGNSTVWIGTDGNGFKYLDGDSWKTIEFPTEFTNGYAATSVIDNDGHLWMSTQGTGVVEIINQNVVRHISSEDGLLDDFARGLAVDDDNNVWVGTNIGISVVNQNGTILKSITQEQGLANEFTITMISDSKNRIWHGSYGGGISLIEEDKITVFDTSNGLNNDQVFSLFEHSSGKIFIGTSGSGITIYDQGDFHHFDNESHGVPLGTVSGIVEDDQQNLWFATGNGIFKVNPSNFDEIINGSRKTIDFELFTQEDGLPTDGMEPANGKTSSSLSNGELIFASVKGVVVIDPNSADLSESNFYPYIDEFVVDEKSLNLLSLRNLTPDDKKIEISYSALNIRAPKKTRFRIKLDGVDDDWVNVGNRTTAFYDFLPDGDYEFHVSAIGPNGMWSEKTASIGFSVLPPYYKTWWFIGLCLIGFSGFIAGGIRLYYRAKVTALNRELAYQQKIHHERERISRDLHDNVGSQITNLITGLEISQLHFEKNESEKAMEILSDLDADARGAMTELRETIWLMDKEEIPTSVFLDHLKGYIRRQSRYLPNTKTEIVANNDLTKILKPAESLNLMRIIQEALNNTRKYANATLFKISFHQNGNNLSVIIEDDGVGMDLSSSAELGNGIGNMKIRSDEIAAELLIESEVDKGTHISIKL